MGHASEPNVGFATITGPTPTGYSKLHPHQVVAAANDYADHKDSLHVQLSHFQLEEKMPKSSCVSQVSTADVL